MKGRLRVHMCQNHMSYEEADILFAAVTEYGLTFCTVGITVRQHPAFALYRQTIRRLPDRHETVYGSSSQTTGI